MKTWPNPFITQRADPFILHCGQDYYFTASVPEYDGLEIRHANTLEGLREAKPVTVWHKPDSGPLSQLIWAPEMHRVDARWVFYFAAAPSRDYVDGLFQHRMYALLCEDADPLKGRWHSCHQIITPLDTFSLDATYCQHQGRNWLLWAQKNPAVPGNSCLYLAELSNPWTIKGQPLLLSCPEYAWEKAGASVNEAPSTLIHNNRLFVAYSAGATDERYCMGLLWIDIDADPLQRNNWIKLANPVFSSSGENKQFGPEHCCFTVDERGRDVLIYHTRNHTGMKGDALIDPSRHTRLKYFNWHADSMPDFGLPPAENHTHKP